MDSLAVLISGGLDSAILLGNALPKHDAVFPLYIRCGLYWGNRRISPFATVFASGSLVRRCSRL